MSNKFNATALTEYSRAYARRIAADFYHNHSVINGRQILNLTPIAQINLFAISMLSEKWRADVEKFRSPYFDFSHPEVEEALRGFMNVVSQHIAVRRENLEPLLADATKRTIVLLFDPRAYFDDALRNQPDFTLTADAIRQLTRYTQINKFVPVTVEQRMNGRQFIYVNQALGYLDEVLAQRGGELERYEKYMALFSEKVPMDLSALLRSPAADGFATQPTKSFFDSELDTMAEPPTPEPVRSAAPIPTSERPPQERPASEPTYFEPSPPSRAAEPPARESQGMNGNHYPEPAAPANQPNGYSGSSYTPTTDPDPFTINSPSDPASPSERPTLNDYIREAQNSASGYTEPPATSAEPKKPEPAEQPEYRAEPVRTEPTSVGDAYYRAPIESIGKSISLNQKFRFINQLFNGNTGAFNQAIDELDRVGNYGQALDLISYRYASQYLWDMSSDEVSELVEILKRRFA